MPEDCVKSADTLESLDGGKNAVNQMEQQDVTHKMQNITFAQAWKPCDLHEALMADKMGGDKARDCEGTRPDLPAQNTDGRDSVLHQRHLRVLLVEDDDSTRHVVGALLRNCSYDDMLTYPVASSATPAVIPAQDGMRAWELLMDVNKPFDLVLTDVMMPGLSGMKLLAKIMAAEAHKNLPVIMMSSQDSVDLVLKCFQNGAADFLVKPVRKNELKNLWQHVWRKANSSSGSGSGSEIEKAVTKSRVGSDHGSGGGSDDGGNGCGSGSSLNAKGSSDNGSGTRIVEAPRVHGRGEKAAERREESKGLKELVLSKSRPCQGAAAEVAAAAPVEGSPNLESEVEELTPGVPSTSPTPEQSGGEVGTAMEVAGISSRSIPETSLSGPHAIDLLAGLECQSLIQSERELGGRGDGVDTQMADPCSSGSRGLEYADGRGSSSLNGRGRGNEEVLLELTLKRPREEEGAAVWEGKRRKGLRQSGVSAFSRYTARDSHMQSPLAAPQPQPYANSPTFATNSLSPHGAFSQSEAAMQVTPHPHPRQLYSNAPDLSTQPISPPDATCPSPNNATPTSILSPRAAPGRVSIQGSGFENVAGNSYYTAGFYAPSHTLTSLRNSANHAAAAAEGGGGGGKDMHTLGKGSLAETHSRFSRSHTHHHHHHDPEDNQLTREQMQEWGGGRILAPQVAASRKATYAELMKAAEMGPTEMDVRSNRGSGGSGGLGSGSIWNGAGANGSTARSNVVIKEGVSNEQSGLVGGGAGEGEGGTDNTGSGADNRGTPGGAMGVDGGGRGGSVVGGSDVPNRQARREVALNKFRLKRKERCFEKKVRYQSRKRLAEQRPRIRGQFVRQVAEGER